MMSRLEGEERRRSSGFPFSDKAPYPPPFLGPAPHTDMGYFKVQERPGGDGVHRSGKKSLVDRISRTLDKLAAVGSQQRDPQVGLDRRARVVVYPAYHQPTYSRTVRAPHGVSYHYMYGSPGAPAASWQDPNWHQDLPAPSPPPAACCRCPDQGKDSVRGPRSSRCKTCGKGRSPYVSRTAQGPVRQRPRLPQTSPDGAGVVRSASSAAWEASRARPSPVQGPRDPYDYIRRTRLRAEEWDTYWESGREARETPSPGRESLGRAGGERQRMRMMGARTHQTPSPREDSRGSAQVRRPLAEMEDEDSQPESKPISSTPPPAKERSATPVEQPDQLPAGKEDSSPTPSTDEQQPSSSEESGAILESHLSASLLADLVTMKSKMSAAEMRYRKFQRRNPLRKLSLQIDDVIMEEDEDALEDVEEKDSGSEDELGLGKFRQVLGSTNLADEILSEIYGSTEGSAGQPRLSLAEEILEELYGSTGPNTTQEEEEEDEEARYCSIEEVLENEEEETKRGHGRLYRSLSLQEKPAGGLSQLLHDTTRFKLSHRPSLAHLVRSGLPGTPTLHRPPLPPPPPPPHQQSLKPFNSVELSRINSKINKNNNIKVVEEDSSGGEFSEDEFDPVEADYENEFDSSKVGNGLNHNLDEKYENIPMVRPAPEGAEADAQYDVPELNESFEEEEMEEEKAELDSSFESSRLADMSSDSLMVPRILDTSFDRDSMESIEQEEKEEKSVIERQEGRTIILSPGMALLREAEREEAGKVSISSSSWVQVGGGDKEGVQRVHVVQEVNGNQVVDKEGEEDKKEEVEEPVKPPRLKKLARQQSKQELLRAKGFGQTKGESTSGEQPKTIKGLNQQNRGRPEISPPVLINSTLNSVDLELHKCITLHRSDRPFLLHQHRDEEEKQDSVYKAASESTESDTMSIYADEAALEEAYSKGEQQQEEVDTKVDPYNEHIYEEIPECRHRVRPLPPIPEGGLGEASTAVAATSKSIFTGATKYEILHYLQDARQRIEGQIGDFDSCAEESELGGENNNGLGIHRNAKLRVSAGSNLSDSSSSSTELEGGVLWRNGNVEKLGRSVEVERNDSGVGSDSGHSGSAKAGETKEVVQVVCPDCELAIVEGEETICAKCLLRRSERKEIITEIVETEGKYGRDLRIIVEEFYRPMLVAGLLSSDQLASIFLNVEQLIQVNSSFCHRLKEALDLATSTGDEELTGVNVGGLFIQSMPMLQAFETYCTKQAASSMLLATMEREKELLRVFLKVSQMENKILRRMNLSSFLMVPVQRITKYPLLLARLLKVTPGQHSDRENIREAQTRIEAALEQINKDAKELIAMKGSWRRAGAQPKKAGVQREMNNMRVRKLSLEMLGWGREETRFALEGRLTFAHLTDSTWRSIKWKGSTNTGIKLMTANALLVVTSRPGFGEVPCQPASSGAGIIFPRAESVGAAVLLLVREKTSRFATVREPFFLDRAVICCEQEGEVAAAARDQLDYFEIQEFGNKDSYVFKAEESSMTGTWFRALQYYSQCLGGWRRRRRGLPNIMVDPGVV